MELKEAARILAEIANKNGVRDDYDYNVEELTRKILDGSDLYEEITSYFTGELDGTIVTSESSRGAEGDGAEMYGTFKIKTEQEEVYVEFSGRYSSWDSSSYDDFYFVQPEEVMVTQYKRIK
jgi:hypothetical protein